MTFQGEKSAEGFDKNTGKIVPQFDESSVELIWFIHNIVILVLLMEWHQLFN